MRNGLLQYNTPVTYYFIINPFYFNSILHIITTFISAFIIFISIINIYDMPKTTCKTFTPRQFGRFGVKEITVLNKYGTSHPTEVLGPKYKIMTNFMVN